MTARVCIKLLHGLHYLSSTMYSGVALKYSQAIQMRLVADLPSSREGDTDSEVEYPLTPPSSDTSESGSLSPDCDDHMGVVTIRIADLQESRSRKSSRQRNVLKRRKSKFIH